VAFHTPSILSSTTSRPSTRVFALDFASNLERSFFNSIVEDKSVRLAPPNHRMSTHLASFPKVVLFSTSFYTVVIGLGVLTRLSRARGNREDPRDRRDGIVADQSGFSEPPHVDEVAMWYQGRPFRRFRGGWRYICSFQQRRKDMAWSRVALDVSEAKFRCGTNVIDGIH
jgi:hypothetical protein